MRLFCVRFAISAALHFAYFIQFALFLPRWEKVEKNFQKSCFFAQSLLSNCARFGIIGIIRSCAPRRFADDAFGSSPDDARFTDATTPSKRDKIRLRDEENLKFVRRNVDTLSKERTTRTKPFASRFSPFSYFAQPSISATSLSPERAKSEKAREPFQSSTVYRKPASSTARRATTFNVGGSSTLKEGRRGAKIADNF